MDWLTVVAVTDCEGEVKGFSSSGFVAMGGGVKMGPTIRMVLVTARAEQRIILLARVTISLNSALSSSVSS